MVKRGHIKRAPRQAGSKASDRATNPFGDDDLDKFHKSKDKLALNPEQDSDPGEDILGSEDEGVLDIEDPSDDELDSEADVEDGDLEEGDKKLAALSKQEKQLRARLQRHQAEDEDESESDEGEELVGAQWGKGKKAYYAGDEDLDDKAAKEEEEEALRLQRQAAEQLRPEDHELSGASSSGEEASEDDDTLGAQAEQAVQIEELPREVGELTEQQRAAIVADAPELEALLHELKDGLEEIRNRLAPLLKEVRGGQLVTKEGLSYLEAKHLLLLHYCLHITFYLLLKAEGRSVADHPVIAGLVKIRAYLERIRPLDKRLRYQMDKLLAAAAAAQNASEDGADVNDEGADGLRFGPRPEALTVVGGPITRPSGAFGAAEDGGEAGDSAGVYRPPRINPTTMDDGLDPDKDTGKRGRRAGKEAARRAAQSELVQDLAAELAGAPEELREAGQVEVDTAEMRRVRARLAARAEAEEELMARVPLNKQERKQLKTARRGGMAGGALLDDFADEIGHLVQAEFNGPGSGSATKEPSWDAQGVQQPASVSQRFGVNAQGPVPNPSVQSGDADLPPREALYERRARLDSARARQAAQLEADEDDMPEELTANLAGKRAKRAAAPAADDTEEPNEDYDAAAAVARDKKRRRQDKYAAQPLHPPVAAAETEGPRAISRAVEKNRGLTPHRRKDIKNPRVKGKKRFEKATKRRRGQVQDVRKPAGGYGGEKSGIKRGVTKSTRFS